MEPACRDTKEWQGVVGLRLGSCLYVDLSMDACCNPRGFDDAIDSLVNEVSARTEGSFSCRPSRNIEMVDLGWSGESTKHGEDCESPPAEAI